MKKVIMIIVSLYFTICLIGIGAKYNVRSIGIIAVFFLGYYLSKHTNRQIMNWRNISEVGPPLDGNKSYLVTDGNECSTTEISITKNYTTGETKFNRWVGDENTYEDNQCCSGEKMLELEPTHWIPTDEIELPT